MKRLLAILTSMAMLVGFTACEQPSGDVDNTTPKVDIKVDKLTIKADGKDSVTFKVIVDGKERTSECQILNVDEGTILEGYTFTTTTAGVYNFKAAFGSATSDTIRVTAEAVDGNDEGNDDGNDEGNDEGDGSTTSEVALKADKTEIVANNTDVVTFTVTVNGEDKTSEATITNLNYKTTIEGNTFSSDVAGVFKFEATVDGVKSNEVEVTATAVSTPVEKKLKLTVDKIRIKADGDEKATFTVTFGQEDVTAKSEVYVEQGNKVLPDATFSTTAPATYTFRARYNGQTSPFVTVEAYDPELAGKYEPGMLYNENGVKGIIFAVKGFPVYDDTYENVIGTDSYCYIISLDEAYLQWSTEYEWCNCNSQRGDYNTSDPFDRFGMDINNYPAFKWCIDHGEGWFMPSSTELNWLWETITNGERDFKAPSVAEFNKIMTDNGGMPFQEDYYWSSNETSEDLVEVLPFMNDSIICLDPLKDKQFFVRAAYRFFVGTTVE